MNEGMLKKQFGKIFPYNSLNTVIYGFNNKYGSTCTIRKGGPNPTKVGKDEEKDIIELNIYGLLVKPEDLEELPMNHVKYVTEAISLEEKKKILSSIVEEPGNEGISPKYNEEKGIFETLTREEMIAILRTVSLLPERKITRGIRLPIEIKSDLFADKVSKYDIESEVSGIEIPSNKQKKNIKETKLESNLELNDLER